MSSFASAVFGGGQNTSRSRWRALPRSVYWVRTGLWHIQDPVYGAKPRMMLESGKGKEFGLTVSQVDREFDVATTKDTTERDFEMKDNSPESPNSSELSPYQVTEEAVWLEANIPPESNIPSGAPWEKLW